MNISVKQVLAPFIGALVGFLASKGLSLSPDQTTALTGLLAGAVGAGVHTLEVWISARNAPLPPPSPSTQKTLPKALLPFALLVLAGGIASQVSACAGSPVRSVDEGLYAAYGAYATLEQTLAEGVTGGWVSKDQARAIDAKASAARAMLDAARVAESSSPATASQDLAAAAQALQALQGELTALEAPAQPKG